MPPTSPTRFRLPAARTLALAVLLAGGALALPAPPAAGQDLTVDGANSPYTVTASASFGNVTVGNTGTGVLDHRAGTLTVNDTLFLGFDAGSSGTYSLSGTGSSLSTGLVFVGYRGSGTFTQSGGSVTTNIRLYLGLFGGSSGTYNLSGGSLSTGRTQVSDDNNTASFTQSGGTHTTATLSLTGYNTLSRGTYHLDGGTLAAGTVTSGDNNVRGTSTFNFNGGTLQARANNATYFQALSAANVRAGGARFDTNGFAVTVAQNLVHSTLSGDAATDGGLTKLGAGTLTLTGANTYTGATTVSAGTLIVNGSTAAGSAVTVAGGATLGGSGTVGGSVSVQGGGTLSPGNSPGRLTLGGSLSLAAGSTLAIEIGGTAVGSFDQVFLAGPLTLGGNLSVVAVGGFTLVPGQTFVILDQSGSGLSAAATPFANAPLGVYTDAAGDRFLVNYVANADNGALPNDVTLQVLSVVPEPSTWALLLAGLGGVWSAAARSRFVRVVRQRG